MTLSTKSVLVHLVDARGGMATTVARLAYLLAIAIASPSGAEPSALNTVMPPPYTNSIGMEFVWIPSGSFLMGSPDGDPEARAFEKPQHHVTLSRPFYLARFELTQAQWKEVMGEEGYALDRSNAYYSLPGIAKRITLPKNPVTVSWNDAQAFITRLNAREGHQRYRLPTEAQWEYAARAGTNSRYSFGDDHSQLHRYAWYGEDFQSGGSHTVGQKLPNPWGLHDMHGNVWEWVQDWYDPGYFSHSPAVDPEGPPSGSHKVVRGGSWHASATSWRSAFRREYLPDYRGISIGFRVLMEAPEGR